MSQLIASITGHEVEVELDEEGNIQVPASSPLAVHLVYVTGRTKSSVRRGEALLKEGTPRYGGMRVMSEELCSSSLRIPFE